MCNVAVGSVRLYHHAHTYIATMISLGNDLLYGFGYDTY